VTNVHAGTCLFDLARDPGGTHHAFDAADTRALELLGTMTTRFSTRKYEETAAELDEGVLEKLRSLGYLR
jgi:hypothetical protein